MTRSNFSAKMINSEPYPPPDPTLSKKPEKRAETASAFLFHAGVSSRRTYEHRLLIISFRIRKDFVRAYSKISPWHRRSSAAGGGIVMFQPRKEPSRAFAKPSMPATGFVLTLPLVEQVLDCLWGDRQG